MLGRATPSPLLPSRCALARRRGSSARVNAAFRLRVPLIEAELAALVPRDGTPLLPGMPHDARALDAGLVAPLRDLLDRGGKRWRPVLMCLFLDALSAPVDVRALRMAAAVELVHSATLIMDDVQDQGVLRRGAPCVHRVYGVDLATNAANAAYFMSLNAIAQAMPPAHSPAVLQAFAAEMTHLHLGQCTDLVWHRGITYVPALASYMAMCSGKTSALARLAARLACALADAPRESEAALVEFAESIGISFQIVDDVLDLTSSSFAAGKGFARDLVEGKLSLMVLWALHNSPPSARERLQYLLATLKGGKCEHEHALLVEAVALLNDTGAVAFARQEALRVAAEAQQALERRSLATADLCAFSRFVVERLT